MNIKYPTALGIYYNTWYYIYLLTLLWYLEFYINPLVLYICMYVPVYTLTRILLKIFVFGSAGAAMFLGRNELFFNIHHPVIYRLIDSRIVFRIYHRSKRIFIDATI